MPSTANAAFRQFLSAINPSPSDRHRASTSQEYIRQVLSNRYNHDPIFPRIERDFLIGSAIRWTKIVPLDDIDVFKVLDGSGLCLLDNGRAIPSVIEGTGGLSNPLLDLCDADTILNSVRVLNRFRDTIRNTYQDSEVRRDGQAVTVYLTSSGFSIDVVPAVFVTSTSRHSPRYYIPTGNSSREWKATNSDFDKKRVEDANKIHNGLASHIVNLFKYWNQSQNRNRLRSYHTGVVCLGLLGSDPISTYTQGITRVFSGASRAISTSCPDPKGLEGPLDSYLSYDARRRTIARLDQAASSALMADLFVKLGLHEDAISRCSAIFGPEFMKVLLAGGKLGF